MAVGVGVGAVCIDGVFFCACDYEHQLVVVANLACGKLRSSPIQPVPHPRTDDDNASNRTFPYRAFPAGRFTGGGSYWIFKLRKEASLLLEN